MSERKSYNILALTNALIRDKATLISKYEKTSKRSKIQFICNCGKEGQKNCLEIVSRAGAFCKECTRHNSINKLHKTRDADCTLETLNNIIKRDNAELLVQYASITKNTIINFKCNCGQDSEKNCLQLIMVSGAFCEECTRINWTNNTKKTNLERYGVECTAQAPHIKEIIKQSNLSNYGVENPLQSPEIREKIKETILEKYGVEHILHSLEIREKVKQTCLEKYGAENPLLCDEIREKAKQTLVKKYGVEYISQTQEFKDKFKQTCLERYGVKHVSQTEEFKDKFKQTCIERYGVDNPNKTSEVRDKIKKTCIERYGVENPSQNIEIQEKTQKNAKKYKEYKMPSGTTIKVQGYEPYALDELIKIYEETDIITARKDIPRISYTVEDKQKYYFPDIYIPSENKIIEVKSNWTYNCKEDNIKEKANATKEAGFDYEIWVYDDKGNKTII